MKCFYLSRSLRLSSRQIENSELFIRIQADKVRSEGDSASLLFVVIDLDSCVERAPKGHLSEFFVVKSGK